MISREFVGGPMDGDVTKTFDEARTIYVPITQPPTQIFDHVGTGLPDKKTPRLVGVYTLDERGDLVWAGEVWR